MAGFSCFPSRRGFRPASSTASFPDFGDISADVVAPIRATPPRLRELSARSIAAVSSLRSPFPRGSPYVSPRPKRSRLSRRERQVRKTADAEVRPPTTYRAASRHRRIFTNRLREDPSFPLPKPRRRTVPFFGCLHRAHTAPNRARAVPPSVEQHSNA